MCNSFVQWYNYILQLVPIYIYKLFALLQFTAVYCHFPFYFFSLLHFYSFTFTISIVIEIASFVFFVSLSRSLCFRSQPQLLFDIMIVIAYYYSVCCVVVRNTLQHYHRHNKSGRNIVAVTDTNQNL